MSQAEKKKQDQTPQEKLDSMRKVLKGYRRKIAKLQATISKTRLRLKGAKKEVVQRRFKHDLKLYQEQLTKLKGQESWAVRTIDQLEMALACDNQGNLKQSPFSVLGSIKLD